MNQESQDSNYFQKPFLGAIDFIKNAIHNFPSIFTLPLPQSECQMFQNVDQKFPGLTQLRKSPDTSQNIINQNFPTQDQIPKDVTPPPINSFQVPRPSLSSNKTFKKTPFEPWEDNIIREQQSIQGNHWKHISNLLPNRSPCSIKNRWYTVLRYFKDSNKQPSSSPTSNEINPSYLPQNDKNEDENVRESNALLDILKNVQNQLHKGL